MWKYRIYILTTLDTVKTMRFKKNNQNIFKLNDYAPLTAANRHDSYNAMAVINTEDVNK